MHQDHFQTKLDQAERRAREAEDKLAKLNAELQAVYASRSWRITIPLRWFSLQIQLLRKHGFKSRLKALIKKLVRAIVGKSINFINSHTQIRRSCVSIALKLGLYERIKTLFIRAQHFSYEDKLAENQISNNDLIVSNAVGYLSPRARKILDDLRREIKAQKNRGES